MDNLIALHYDLATNNYQHGGYHAFKIHDPKPELINSYLGLVSHGNGYRLQKMIANIMDVY